MSIECRPAGVIDVPASPNPIVSGFETIMANQQGDANVAQSKIVVLVVEDEPLVRLGIVDHLEDEGFTVLEASNAQEAVDILINNLDIQIMFTDVDMPGGMDGLKLAATVRDRWPPIKIVVTSGHRAVDVGDLPDEAQFFPKPYNPDKISAVFRQLLH